MRGPVGSGPSERRPGHRDHRDVKKVGKILSHRWECVRDTENPDAEFFTATILLSIPVMISVRPSSMVSLISYKRNVQGTLS